MDSVENSARDSAWHYIEGFVRCPVYNSVVRSVESAVNDFIKATVRDSIRDYFKQNE